MEHKIVDGYTIKYKLGEGGMAEVWYAENAETRPVAVKILQKQFCSMPEIVNRFENEANLMVHLTHPHIRNIYHHTIIDGRPCMIMEYLEGNDLGQRMKQGERFSDEQLTAWWNDLVDVLQYTHSKNIIHRDIKPSNLFLTNQGNIKVLDFGIAKLRDNIGVTQTGSRMGTLLYMSPEQVYDTKTLTYKTDIYSLAVTFYHLVTGKVPYDSTKTSDFEIQESIVRKDVDVSTLPAPWKYVLPGYLQKNPDQRSDLQKINGNENEYHDKTIVYSPVIDLTPEATPKEEVPYPPNRRSSFPLFFSFLVIAGLILLALNKDRVIPLVKKYLSSPNKTEKPVTIAHEPRNNVPAHTEEQPTVPNVKIQMDTTVSQGENGATDEVITTGDFTEKENNIKSIINEYYRSRSDCNTLSRFFPDTILQYYNKSNVLLENAMKECESYHNKWKFTEANISNDSYVFTHEADGNSFVDFNMLYKIKKLEEDDWMPYNIDVSAVFDKNIKIIRIVERRIEKL